MLSTMKSIILIALAAILTIANTEAHPSPKENNQCGHDGICDWAFPDANRVRSYCSTQKRRQLLIYHAPVNEIYTQHLQP